MHSQEMLVGAYLDCVVTTELEDVIFSIVEYLSWGERDCLHPVQPDYWAELAAYVTWCEVELPVQTSALN